MAMSVQTSCFWSLDPELFLYTTQWLHVLDVVALYHTCKKFHMVIRRNGLFRAHVERHSLRLFKRRYARPFNVKAYVEDSIEASDLNDLLYEFPREICRIVWWVREAISSDSVVHLTYAWRKGYIPLRITDVYGEYNTLDQLLRYATFCGSVRTYRIITFWIQSHNAELLENDDNRVFDDILLYEAARSGKIEMLNVVVQRHRKVHTNTGLPEFAEMLEYARDGNLSLNTVIERYRKAQTNIGLPEFAEMLENARDANMTSYIFRMLAKHLYGRSNQLATTDSFDRCITALRTVRESCPMYCVANAAFNGNLAQLRMLHVMRFPTRQYTAFFAALGGQIEVLKWAHYVRFPITEDVLQAAMRRRHNEVCIIFCTEIVFPHANHGMAD